MIITHSHGQHGPHTHGEVQYANHQRPIDDEVILGQAIDGLVEYTERTPHYAGLTVHEIRAEALDAAVRIADSAEMPDGWTVRDHEALVIGTAERLADWISDGTYDFAGLRDGSTQP